MEYLANPNQEDDLAMSTLWEQHEAECGEESRDQPTEAPAPEPTLTVSQENAIETAESYLDYSAFSESGLVEQLKYEGYSAADSRFAVSRISVSWNEQAAKSAKSYLDYSSFSRSGLIEQLKYEGFTTHQATYGVNQAGL